MAGKDGTALALRGLRRVSAPRAARAGCPYWVPGRPRRRDSGVTSQGRTPSIRTPVGANTERPTPNLQPALLSGDRASSMARPLRQASPPPPPDRLSNSQQQIGRLPGVLEVSRFPRGA